MISLNLKQKQNGLLSKVISFQDDAAMKRVKYAASTSTSCIILLSSLLLQECKHNYILNQKKPKRDTLVMEEEEAQAHPWDNLPIQHPRQCLNLTGREDHCVVYY
jgi:hypothetical protein